MAKVLDRQGRPWGRAGGLVGGRRRAEQLRAELGDEGLRQRMADLSKAAHKVPVSREERRRRARLGWARLKAAAEALDQEGGDDAA